MRKKLWRLIKRALPWAACLAVLGFVGYRIFVHVRYGGPFADENACRAERADFVGVTVNAGLAPGAHPLAHERVQPFAEAMSVWRDADALCLQELWEEPSMQAVTKALALPPDHVYHIDTRGWHEEPGQDVCTHRVLEPTVACIREKCAGVPDENQAICALEKCRIHLAKVRIFNKRCLNCLVATIGESVDDVVRDCTSREGRMRSWGGGNGVGLASKWKLEDMEFIDLPSSAVNRIALFARIRHPVLGDIELACTHITSAQPESPTDPRFKDWEDEQIEQIRIISEKLRARAHGRPTVFLADLNASPRTSPETISESPRAWARAMQEGFSSGAIEKRAFPCTVCEGNELRDGPGRVIDHVMTRDAPSLEYQCAHRILQDRVPAIGPDGKPFMVHPSDHYGVVAKFHIK